MVVDVVHTDAQRHTAGRLSEPGVVCSHHQLPTGSQLTVQPTSDADLTARCVDIERAARLKFHTTTGVNLGRGYEGYAYSPLSKGGTYYTPTFKRYKRPSFEMKLRRNAWAVGALPRTPLREFTDPPVRLRALLL